MALCLMYTCGLGILLWLAIFVIPPVINQSLLYLQLFCLARAFLRNAKILVMDEPTASVDMATDAVIQDITQTAFKDKTIITIAHRVATIVNYDTIVVMGGGKIIEQGSPSELMAKKNGSFATMLKDNK